MFFRKKSNTALSPSFGFEADVIDGIRWNNIEIYGKDGKDSKLLKTERVLQYRRVNGAWENVWTQFNNPVYLDQKNG